MLHDEVDGHCGTETNGVRESSGRQGHTHRAVTTQSGYMDGHTEAEAKTPGKVALTLECKSHRSFSISSGRKSTFAERRS